MTSSADAVVDHSSRSTSIPRVSETETLLTVEAHADDAAPDDTVPGWRFGDASESLPAEEADPHEMPPYDSYLDIQPKTPSDVVLEPRTSRVTRDGTYAPHRRLNGSIIVADKHNAADAPYGRLREPRPSESVVRTQFEDLKVSAHTLPGDVIEMRIDLTYTMDAGFVEVATQSTHVVDRWRTTEA